MKRHASVDLSLRERHTVLDLLKRVEAEATTLSELKEIGECLNRAGRSAISPLVRRIWKEKRSDVICRYAFILDCFEDESWHDQLVEILFKRSDMDHDGALALAATLEAHGVDLDDFPVQRWMSERWPLPESARSLLDEPDNLARFLDDFLSLEPDDRSVLIRNMGEAAEPDVIDIFEVLFSIDDVNCRKEILTALGRMRKTEAATLLKKLSRDNCPPECQVEASRSLRRLSFLGVMPQERRAPSVKPIDSAFVSPVDGSGYRVIWICRPGLEKGFVTITFQVHDQCGVNSVWGVSKAKAQECADNAAALGTEEGAVEVSPEYALSLLRDAVFKSTEPAGQLLPGEFYAWRRFMAPEEVKSEQYHVPPSPAISPAKAARYVMTGDSLFDHDFFAGWVVVSPAVYDHAESWLRLEAEGVEGRELNQRLDQLVKEFYQLLMQPQLDTFGQRLLMVADLLRETGATTELCEQVHAVADSLSKPLPFPHRHPFLRRFALESMDLAREALKEGYDLRLEW